METAYRTHPSKVSGPLRKDRLRDSLSVQEAGTSGSGPCGSLGWVLEQEEAVGGRLSVGALFKSWATPGLLVCLWEWLAEGAIAKLGEGTVRGVGLPSCLWVGCTWGGGLCTHSKMEGPRCCRVSTTGVWATTIILIQKHSVSTRPRRTVGS